MPAQAQPKFVSFAPDAFVAGGLINDVDVEVEHAEFTVDGPEGYSESALFLKLSLKQDDGSIVDQWWSAGKKAYENFTPTDDGARLQQTGSSTGLVRGSNLHTFMESLVAKGFPKAKCDDASNLKGIKMHVVQVPQKRGAGMSPAKDDRERTILVCERLISLPGEKGRSKAAAKPPARAAAPAAPAPAAEAPAAAAAAEANGDAESQALAAIQTVLSAAKDNQLSMKLLRASVFRSLSGTPTEDRNAILKLVTDTPWLEANGFLVDGETVAYIP